MASSGKLRDAFTAAVTERGRIPDEVNVTRTLPNGSTLEKVPVASLMTVSGPNAMAIPESACPPLVAVTRPVTVALVGAGAGMIVVVGSNGCTVGVVVGPPQPTSAHSVSIAATPRTQRISPPFS